MRETTGGTICPLCGSTIPLGTGHACGKVVPADPFPCPSCASLRAELDRLKEMNAALNRSYLLDRIVLVENENAALRSRVALLEKVAVDILANGYDQGRRIALRAAVNHTIKRGGVSMAIACLSIGCSCPKCNPDYWCIEGERLMDEVKRLEGNEDALADIQVSLAAEHERLREIYRTGLALRECEKCGEWLRNWQNFIDAVDMAKAEYAQEVELRAALDAAKEGMK